jgi:hypothetical protein
MTGTVLPCSLVSEFASRAKGRELYMRCAE